MRASLARYFFNIFDGVDIFDGTGTELHNVNEVRLHMLAMAKGWIEKPEHQDTHWKVKARDEHENFAEKFGSKRSLTMAVRCRLARKVKAATFERA